MKHTTALTGVLAMAACGLVRTQQTDPRWQASAAAAAPPQHITQLGFGREARYARCTEPACPATTAKTLATASSAAASVAITERIPGATPALAPQRVQTSTTPVTPTSKPEVLVLRFQSDSAALSSAHKALLSRVASVLGHAERILILGRTDAMGSSGPNQAMALARAVAVRDHLRSLVPALPEDIRIDARGLCCYAATNGSAEGRAQNRRVEVVFTASAAVQP